MESDTTVFNNENALTLDEVHTVDYELIQEVDSFCSSHNLKYYLAYGTLLGAVRHQGFIPWDDDADIWMPRDDYEKFISSFSSDKEHIAVLKPYTDRYHFSWLKLVDCRTKYSNKRWETAPEQYGLSIDIFPLDYDIGKRRFSVVHISNEIRRKAHKVGCNNLIYSIALMITKIIPSLMDGRFQERIIRKSHSESHYLTLHSPYDYSKECMPTEWFGEGQYCDFENSKFVVPDEPEKILEHLYGDWSVHVKKKQHASFFWRTS